MRPSRRRAQTIRVSTPLEVSSTALRLERVIWAMLIAGLVLTFSTAIELQFTLPKLLVLQITAPLLIGLWAWRLAHGGVRSLPQPLVLATVTLAGWWVLTTATAVHPRTALDGAFGHFNGLWTHLLFLTLFSLLASSRLTLTDIEGRLRVLVSSLTISGLYALAQYIGWDPIDWYAVRPGSTIGNPVPLAACLGLGIPFAFALAARAQDRVARSAWIASSAILILAALSTGSRGPLLGILASAFVFGWTAAGALGTTKRKMMVAALVIGTIAVLAASRARPGHFFQSPGGDSAVQDRMNIMGAALRVAGDYPLRGVGLENFAVVYPRYRAPAAERLTPDEVPTTAHNGYVQAAATTGVPGLVLYLAFAGSVVLLIARRLRARTPSDRLLLAAFLASLTAYLVADLTGWLEVSLTGLFWIVLGLAASAALSDQDSNRFHQRTRVAVIGFAVVWAALVCQQASRTITIATGDLLFREAAQSAGHVAWGVERTKVERGLELVSDISHYADAAALHYAVRFGMTGEQESFDRAAQLFDSAHRLDPFNEYILIHRIDLETAAVQKRPGPLSTDAQVAARILAAGDFHNATTHEALARLHLASGEFAAAMESITRALKLRPSWVSYVTLKGDIDHAVNQLPEAIASYRAAGEAASLGSATWIDAKHKLTMSLLEVGDAPQAAVEARGLIAGAPTDDIGHRLLALAEAEVAKDR
jgi:O-antigen ligase